MDSGPGVPAADQHIQIHMKRLSGNIEAAPVLNKVKELPLWMEERRRKKERAESSSSLGGVRGLTEEHQVGGQQPLSGWERGCIS